MQSCLCFQKVQASRITSELNPFINISEFSSRISSNNLQMSWCYGHLWWVVWAQGKGEEAANRSATGARRGRTWKRNPSWYHVREYFPAYSSNPRRVGNIVAVHGPRWAHRPYGPYTYTNFFRDFTKINDASKICQKYTIAATPHGGRVPNVVRYGVWWRVIWNRIQRRTIWCLD
jgi:hypothetical protein